ncbi:MAG: hypothetical protein SGPRY_007386 [Prymnesium sp.]
MQPAVAGQLEAMEHSLERAASERPPTDQLVDAIRVGDLETCKILASQAPDGLGGRDSVDHATPAHWAALNGQLKILEWLAAAGSPLHERVDRSGMQPLHWACTRGHTEVVKMLLAHGGDIDSLDIKSTPPLVIAAQYDHTILVFFLVRAKADINLLDDCDDSALHWAAYKGNSQTLALLSYLGLPFDAADAYGSTPLHLAAMRGATNVVEFLLESPEAPRLLKMTDNKGRTPLQVAMERGEMLASRLLKAAQPSSYTRYMSLLMGDDGSKMMFYFYIINGSFAYLAYALLFAPAIGYVAQHWAYLGVNLLMQIFYVSAHLRNPGVIDVAAGGSEYEHAMEMAADGKLEQTLQLPLCHTCRIVKPLRSKHCSKFKRCISVFDHHCPYVGTTLGAGNYRSFVMFMFFGFFGVSMTAVAALQYVLTMTFNVVSWIILVDMALVTVMAMMMNSYHISLIVKNLTTNEHMNLRYPYLRDELGRFQNGSAA